MIDIDKLVVDLTTALPNEWTVLNAEKMDDTDSADLAEKVPMLTIYQSDENYGVADGSPCYQMIDSEIALVVVCKTIELKSRMKAVRDALKDWEGDEDYHRLYRKLFGRRAGRINVNAVYTWWREFWATSYKI